MEVGGSNPSPRAKEDTLEEKDLYWVAGLLEGEGSFNISKQTSHGRHYQYARVMCNMSDEDVIRKLHRVTGLGTLGGPYKAPGKKRQHWNPMWRWTVAAQKEVGVVLNAVYPLMGDRRQKQIRDVLTQVPVDGCDLGSGDSKS